MQNSKYVIYLHAAHVTVPFCCSKHTIRDGAHWRETEIIYNINLKMVPLRINVTEQMQI